MRTRSLHLSCCKVEALLLSSQFEVSPLSPWLGNQAGTLLLSVSCGDGLHIGLSGYPILYVTGEVDGEGS